MRLVLDTNILIAALLKDSLTREIFFTPGFEFLLPEYALEEVPTVVAAKIPSFGSTPAASVGVQGQTPALQFVELASHHDPRSVFRYLLG